MSTTLEARPLEVIEGGKKTFRAVEVARKQEATSWEMADAIWEDFSSGTAVSDENSARAELLDQITEALVAEGLDYKRDTVKILRQVAEAWPPSERVEGATFTAHRMLRSSSYPNRRANLERLRDRSPNGKVTAHAVKVWVSEKKPRSHKSFLELVDERVRASLKAAAQPWHTVAQDDREQIARLLRVLAEEVQAGEFPKGK